MIKRFLNIILVISILLFNCFPVYALDSFVLDNFINVTFNDTIVTFINNNLENKYLYYLMFRKNGSNNHVIISSTQELSLVQNPDNLKEMTVSNLSTDSAVLISNNSSFNKGEILGSSSFVVNPGGDTNYRVLPELLIYNKDCVNSNYCSTDVYVEMTDPDDYEEDGVIIKGLTAFFNKMTSVLDNILNEIKGIVDSIIGIPEDGYFAEKIENIKTIINEKYNLNSLFSFFEDMKGIEASTPDFSFDKELSINGLKIPFDFYIDFSWFDGEIKDIIFLLFRATGYPLLIIYNLNQVYLLFRGRKFFNEDGGEES